MLKMQSSEIFSYVSEPDFLNSFYSFPVAQLVEASNAKIMGSIPRESKSW